MLNGYIVISSLGAVAMTLLSLFVFFRNSRALLNRLFLLFSLLAACWLSANYLGSTPTVPFGVALIANRLTFLFSAVGTFALYLFVVELVKNKNPWLRRATSIFNVAAGVVAATPLVVASIERAESTYNIHFGIASNLYFFTLLLNTCLMLTVLVQARLRAKSLERSQINTVLVSLGTFLIGVVTTNALFPLLFNYYGLTNAGALFIFVLIGGMAYAITKHKLFDVRLIVARSLGYVLSLGAMGAVFIVGAFLTTGILFRNIDFNGGQLRWLYTFLAVILAFVFAPLKRFFDRSTNRLFFRDVYDPQVFLDQFNKVLVATYQLSPLLRKSAEVIVENVKPTYCAFGIKETQSTPRRIVGTSGHPVYSEADIEYVRSITPRMKRKIIVADELEGKDEKLKTILQDNDIALLARLTSSASEEGIGYILLGPKKSGNLYSSEDIRMIEIIANELVIAVQNSLRFEEIENFNATLQAKVDEATKKLRRTNEKLRELDETKDDFISMASHQLRTPLTSVKGYISMVLEEDAGKINHMQREMLGQAFFSSQRMVYLIADLLNVSRLKTGKFVIEPTPVNLAEVVQQELSQLEETAASRQLTLRFDKPANFPTLLLDETKTRQVIMNFTDNAIYYTPAGGHIVVRLIDNPSTIELRVEDDGIGVPRGEQHHLFTKFYRAGNARKARPDGTGLGLFMAKKVVLAQGGSIIFESREGKGSTFGFVFSKAKLSGASGDSSSKTAASPELISTNKL